METHFAGDSAQYRTASDRLWRIVPAVLLIAVAAACWAVTARRMQGMDMGPGTDLGGARLVRGRVDDDDGGDDASLARADGAHATQVRVEPSARRIRQRPPACSRSATCSRGSAPACSPTG